MKFNIDAGRFRTTLMVGVFAEYDWWSRPHVFTIQLDLLIFWISFEVFIGSPRA